MKRLIYSLIIVLFLINTSESTILSGVFSGTIGAVPGIYASYTYHKCLNGDTTATGANVASTQTNFPIAVHINPSNWTATERTHLAIDQTDGKRVRFFASDHTTVLPYEVEYYSETADIVTEALYWVNVGTITGNNANAGMVCIAYGNDPLGSSQEQVNATWETNFKLVQHLGDNSWGSSPEAKDSTSNAYNGTNAGATPNQAAKVRNGASFITDDNIDFGDVLDMASSSMTISGWVKIAASTTVNQGLVEKRGATGDYWNIISCRNNHGTYPRKLLFYMYDGEVVPMIASAANVDDNVWHYFAGVRTISAAIVYLDLASATHTISNGDISSTTPLRLGNSYTADEPLNGILDEIRIALTNRSADWLRLEYYSMLKTNWNGDSWLTWSAE